ADMPLDLQSTLLRVLEEKSVMRLGGNQVIPVNVRIMAATNKNLEDEITRNRFRKDLYYRLGVIKLNIPPLRDRRDDIPLLVNHFLKLICKRYSKNLYKISPLALQTLVAHDWPGNIRELQNVLEGCVQLAMGPEIDNEFIINYMGLEAEHIQKAISDIIVPDFTSTEESQLLEELLRKNKYNKKKTAQDLGISRQTLYRHLHKYGLL
ncbi:MAG: transcriptional regulator containing AAA-type ATPase, and DNA-binding domain, partial [Firmicutes bacterium]|nr:transcriptional regulator containing AAA-type ATPase, and DNA-binding domain [Bacillota bacterium]